MIAEASEGMAVTLAESGAHEQAIEALTGLLSLQSKANILELRGRSLLQVERFEEALADFDAAIASRPTATAFCGRGEALLAVGDLEEAVVSLSDSLALCETAHVYYLRGYARALALKMDEACVDFRTAIEMDDHYCNRDLYAALPVDAEKLLQQILMDGFEEEKGEPDIACNELVKRLRWFYGDFSKGEAGGLRQSHLAQFGCPQEVDEDYIDRSAVHPLDAVRVFFEDEHGAPHWHYVSLGFSDLYSDNTGGYGFELSIRVRAFEEDTPPSWPVYLLRQLAAYVFSTGNVFDENHHKSLNGPLLVDGEVGITTEAIAFRLDPLLKKFDTASGEVKVLQVVGLTIDEYEALKKWQVEKFLQVLQTKDPMMILDTKRLSCMSDPSVKASVLGGIAAEGSSVSINFIDDLSVSQSGTNLVVTIGALYVESFSFAAESRLRFGRDLTLVGKNVEVVLRPSDDHSYVEKVSDRELNIFVSANDLMS